MENKKGQEPAFPSEYSGGEYDDFGMPIIVHRKYYGMNKRFYAACAAMQGMLSGVYSSAESYESFKKGANQINKSILSHVASSAYQFADELLKQEDE